MRNQELLAPGVDSDTGEYRDPSFESLVRTAQDCLNKARDAVEKGAAGPVAEDVIKDVCRAIRDAKMEFRRVLDFYGAEYEENGQRFVDLTIEASELASKVASDDLRKGLQKHADEVQAMQMEVRQ